MNILGIHDGHLSTAALLVDGQISGMVSEERFTRVKNQGGAPVRAIAWLLENARLEPADVHAVSVATLTEPLTTWEADTRQFRRRMLDCAGALFPGSVVGSPALVRPYVAVYRRLRDRRGIAAALANNGITCGTREYEHHRCHAATAYYLSSLEENGRPVLVVTADASGDGLCATVNVGRNGGLERLHAIPSYHSVGEFYTRITQLLGMKPLEHEYKVMGLAPYAPPDQARRALDIVSRYYRLTRDHLGFVNTAGVWGPGLLRRMRADLEHIRFDAVAAAAQRLLEDIVVPFVLAWVRRTGIRHVALAGGIFMNVKLNMLLSERPEIERLFIMPSCGDESIALGAALLGYADAAPAGAPGIGTEPIRHLYYGTEYTPEEVLRGLEEYGGSVTWTRCGDIDAAVARLVAEGKIVGRLAGRMEWGARSLGNRAILADPRDLSNIRRLNVAVKKRDFWMPFAPSILAERAGDYLDNPRGLDAPFMVNAFRSTPLAHKELACGLHGFDLTCRPQIVERAVNPRFHALISEFERLTGVGGILNTSFNLHGDPIVCSPGDALRTLVHSGLDALALESFLVRRRDDTLAPHGVEPVA